MQACLYLPYSQGNGSGYILVFLYWYRSSHNEWPQGPLHPTAQVQPHQRNGQEARSHLSLYPLPSWGLVLWLMNHLPEIWFLIFVLGWDCTWDTEDREEYERRGKWKGAKTMGTFPFSIIEVGTPLSTFSLHPNSQFRTLRLGKGRNGNKFHRRGAARPYLLSLWAPRQTWSRSTFEGPGLVAPLWFYLHSALSLLKNSIQTEQGHIPLGSSVLYLLLVPPHVSPSPWSFNYSPACLWI